MNRHGTCYFETECDFQSVDSGIVARVFALGKDSRERARENKHEGDRKERERRRERERERNINTARITCSMSSCGPPTDNGISRRCLSNIAASGAAVRASSATDGASAASVAVGAGGVTVGVVRAARAARRFSRPAAKCWSAVTFAL